jgi:Ca-activated chloride channel family protein
MHDYLLWGEPTAFKYLWLVPLLVALYVYAARQRARSARAFFGAQTPPRPRYRNLKAALEIAAVALLLIALARPRIGSELRPVTHTGADVIIAIDTSTSMACQDVAPTRMDAAKQAVTALVARLAGDRVGLIVFGDRPYLYSPLTSDTDALEMFVSAVEVGAAPGPGTNLGRAIQSCEQLFKSAESRGKVLIIVSDGEDHGNDALSAASQLAKEDVVIETVGVGTPQGAPVPDIGDEGLPIGVKHEADGKTAISKLNQKLLADVAKAGHGEVTLSSQSGVSIDKLVYQVAGLGGTKTGAYEFAHHAERFQFPLAAAILCIVMSAIISDIPRRKRSNPDDNHE